MSVEWRLPPEQWPLIEQPSRTPSMKLFEPLIALILLILILPVMVIGWVGLLLVGARPIFVMQEVWLRGERTSLLAFNAASSGFGAWLQRIPPTVKLPSLFQVINGNVRLGTWMTWMNQALA